MLSSNHTIVIFDNREIGNTTAGNKTPSIQQFANDTSALIDVLGIKKPVDIFGLSIHGRIHCSRADSFASRKSK